MPIVQMVKKESVRGTMEEMEIGDYLDLSLDRESTVRGYASSLKKFTGKVYTVNRHEGFIRAKRIQ